MTARNTERISKALGFVRRGSIPPTSLSLASYNAKVWAAASIVPFLLLGVWEHHNGQMLDQAQAAYRSVSEPDRSHTQQPAKN